MLGAIPCLPIAGKWLQNWHQRQSAYVKNGIPQLRMSGGVIVNCSRTLAILRTKC